MDDDAFTFLYLHAGALAELGRPGFSDLAAAGDAVQMPLAAHSGSAPSDRPADEHGAGADGDFDACLRRLYAGRAPLAGRIGALQARLVPEQLRQLAERLPADLPSLLSPMDGAGLSAWLDLYEQGDENLHDIVQRIRCADA